MKYLTIIALCLLVSGCKPDITTLGIYSNEAKNVRGLNSLNIAIILNDVEVQSPNGDIRYYNELITRLKSGKYLSRGSEESIASFASNNNPGINKVYFMYNPNCKEMKKLYIAKAEQYNINTLRKPLKDRVNEKGLGAIPEHCINSNFDVDLFFIVSTHVISAAPPRETDNKGVSGAAKNALNFYVNEYLNAEERRDMIISDVLVVDRSGKVIGLNPNYSFGEKPLEKSDMQAFVAYHFKQSLLITASELALSQDLKN